MHRLAQGSTLQGYFLNGCSLYWNYCCLLSSWHKMSKDKDSSTSMGNGCHMKVIFWGKRDELSPTLPILPHFLHAWASLWPFQKLLLIPRNLALMGQGGIPQYHHISDCLWTFDLREMLSQFSPGSLLLFKVFFSEVGSNKSLQEQSHNVTVVQNTLITVSTSM